jgi:hypothetical protein
MACIHPVSDCQKFARNVPSDALRGRSQAPNIADDQSMGLWSCRHKHTVDRGLQETAMEAELQDYIILF